MTPLSPKDRVLAFVRSKNPASMELKMGCRVSFASAGIRQIGTVLFRNYAGNYEVQILDNAKSTFPFKKLKILGSDMGLQELLIALDDSYRLTILKHFEIFQIHFPPFKGNPAFYADFDLTKNLHEQSDDFYTSLLPLLP